MQITLTVSQLVEAVNLALEALETLSVEGEVDEYKVIHNKWVTFRLKDEESSVGCFMPIWDLKTAIEDGMLVRVTGEPKLRDKGFFSFVVKTVTPAGEGALKRAFELLRAKLTAEGLFAAERKRPLPEFPQHIAFITSRDAAAYSDFLKVLKGRQGGLFISFLHTQVQGVDAPRQIIEALSYANTDLKDLDAVVLVRGGGSLEDLHAFNDEAVIRAVAASRTPTIVGVGHERDITLAELAADVRASTPSNAAEILVRSRQEVLLRLSNWEQRLREGMRRELEQRELSLQHALQTLKSRIAGTADRIRQLSRLLESLSPQSVLARGYSITQSEAGRVVKRAQDVQVGERLLTRLAEGRLTSRAETAS